MSKFVVDAALNEMIKYLKINAVKMVVCLTDPVTYASLQGASHGFNLASATLVSTDFAYDNGDASGRKLTVNAQAALDVVMAQSTATANEIALCSASAIILKTTCTSQLLTNGNTVTVPTFDDEIADAT